jgi:hypothetical protein
MEKQYYTPKIEHFHVGFRYEHFEDWDVPNKEKEWHKQVYGKNGTNWEQMDYVDDSTIANGRIRVKSLDHDDIIEAGWELLDEDPKNIQFFTLRNFILHIESGRVLISIVGSIGLFRGRVKNYNEFIKLMDMLGIKKEAPTKEELAEDSWFERNGLV